MAAPTTPADRRIALVGALGLLQDEGLIDTVELADDWTFVIDGRRHDLVGASQLVEQRRRRARRRLASRFARDHAAAARHSVFAA